MCTDWPEIVKVTEQLLNPKFLRNRTVEDESIVKQLEYVRLADSLVSGMEVNGAPGGIFSDCSLLNPRSATNGRRFPCALGSKGRYAFGPVG